MASDPDSRERVLAEADAAFVRLQALIRGLDEAQATRPGVVGGWSVVQTLGHIVGWLGEARGALERLARGERPGAEGADYSNIDAWNAKFVEVHSEATATDALAAFEAAQTAWRAALAAVPAQRFGAGRSVNTIARNACIAHYAEHAEAIEGALRA